MGKPEIVIHSIIRCDGHTGFRKQFVRVGWIEYVRALPLNRIG